MEDLLAQRGVTVSYETIRHWCQTFGLDYARMLRRRRGRLGDTWYLDEVFVTIHGRRQYLWRAVDQDGDFLDILVQSRRDRRAAVRWRTTPRALGESARPRSVQKLERPHLMETEAEIGDPRVPLRGHRLTGQSAHRAASSPRAAGADRR